MAKIIILDYKLGNLFSVKQACSNLGLNAEVSMNPEDIATADGIILPGVGAFNEAMNNLQELKLVEPLIAFAKSNKPLLGICLGLQLLFDQSDEFGNNQGLGLISGSVLKFPHQINGEKLLVPQIGWNTIRSKEGSTNGFDGSPLHDVKQNEFFYFVHSYYVKPNNEEDILSLTDYNGFQYCSSILKNNIFATQFHPEKSGVEGLKIYKNWAKQFNLI